MSIESANLSPHVLGYIFSYLPPEDLSRAAQVSKSWNTVSKSDDLWRNLAQSILDLSEPAQGSWKEQYKILHRWKTWDSQETTLIPSSFESTLLLQGTTVFELTEDSTQPFLYSMHNLLTHGTIS